MDKRTFTVTKASDYIPDEAVCDGDVYTRENAAIEYGYDNIATANGLIFVLGNECGDVIKISKKYMIERGIESVEVAV